MKKSKLLMASLLASAFALGLSSCTNRQTLLFLNWGEYIDEDILEAFEEKYNCNVSMDLGDSNEIFYSMVKAGTTVYDVVCPSDYMVEKMYSAGLLQEIDFSKLTMSGYNPNTEEGKDSMRKGVLAILDEMNTNLKANNPKYVDNTIQNYFVPYLWGTWGIMYSTYDETKVKEEDRARSFAFYKDLEKAVTQNSNQWASLFDRSSLPNGTKVAMYDSYQHLYYVKVSEDSVSGKAKYVLTTPLGWQEKADEYSAKEDGLSIVSVYDQEEVYEDKRKSRNRGKRSYTAGASANTEYVHQERTNSSEEPNENSEEWEYSYIFKSPSVLAEFEYQYKDDPAWAKLKKEWEKRKKKSATSDNKKAKSKTQAKKAKDGGKKVQKKYKIVPDTSKQGTVGAAEVKCAKETGAYTICISSPLGNPMANLIHSATLNDRRWVPTAYDGKSVYKIADALAKKLGSRKVKSVVLNITGSYMAAMSKYATQQDLDAYMLRLYNAIKERGIYVSKVMSTAQPGIPLASARAAMALKYNLEVVPTADYKVYGENGESAEPNKDKFLANLSDKLASTDYKEENRVYDKEDGPVIEAKNPWTREIAARDKKTLYIFSDNTDRTSGNNKISNSASYSKRHNPNAPKNYPNTTSAVIRGLDNAYPISTQKKYSPSNPKAGNWQDEDWKEFRKVISSEVDDIIEAFESGKYNRVVFPVGGLFDGHIADISKERTPRLYRILSDELDRLSDEVQRISEQIDFTKEDKDEDSYSYAYNTDSNDILTTDDIQFPSTTDDDLGSNLRVFDIEAISSRGIKMYSEDGTVITDGKIFAILPKGKQRDTSENWSKAKLYAQNGERITEKIQFSLKGQKDKMNLTTARDGVLALVATKGLSEVLDSIHPKVPLNKVGLVWLDDSNELICKG